MNTEFWVLIWLNIQAQLKVGVFLLYETGTDINITIQNNVENKVKIINRHSLL